MFRCVSSNVRLTPLYKRQYTNLLSKPLLAKSGFRQTFSTSQRNFQQEVKDQVTTAAATAPKKADRSDVKRLFQLAKPEMKSITGKHSIHRNYILLKHTLLNTYFPSLI